MYRVETGTKFRNRRSPDKRAPFDWLMLGWPAATWMLALLTVGCQRHTQGSLDGGNLTASTGNSLAAESSATIASSGSGADDVLFTAVENTPLQRRSRGEDWPRFLGPRGDGTSAETGLSPERWQPHPPVEFVLDLGTSYGGPTIADGRLLVMDRVGQRERLNCYEATTGRLLWRWGYQVQYSDSYGYNNGPRCAPVVDGNYVYTYGVAGRLACINLEDGQPRWEKDTVGTYGVVQNFFGVASCPYVVDDLLLVMVGGSPAESQGLGPSRLGQVKPNGSAIVAFNKLTGEEVYRLGDELASYSSVMVRELNGEPLGLAFLRGGLLAWAPATGKQAFHFPWRADMLESVNAAQPVVNGNEIFLSECYEIGSTLLRVEDGQANVVWQDEGSRRQQSFRAHWSTPVLIDGFLYGCSGRNQPDSDFRCVRWSDGQVQWSKRTHERSSVLAVDGYLIVLGEYGNLQLVRPDPDQLEVLAEADLGQIAAPESSSPLLSYPCWAAPILSHGLLYVRGRSHLVCFDLIPEEVVEVDSRLMN